MYSHNLQSSFLYLFMCRTRIFEYIHLSPETVPLSWYQGLQMRCPTFLVSRSSDETVPLSWYQGLQMRLSHFPGIKVFRWDCPTFLVSRSSDETVPLSWYRGLQMRLSYFPGIKVFRWDCPTFLVSRSSDETVPLSWYQGLQMRLSHFPGIKVFRWDCPIFLVSRTALLNASKMKMWYHNQTWQAIPSNCFLRFSGRVNSAVSYVDQDLSRYKPGVLLRGRFRRSIGVACIRWDTISECQCHHIWSVSVPSMTAVADPALLLQCSDQHLQYTEHL